MRRADAEAMTITELRAHLFREKEARRRRLSALPVVEKFRLMEQMREEAKAVRVFRGAGRLASVHQVPEVSTTS